MEQSSGGHPPLTPLRISDEKRGRKRRRWAGPLVFVLLVGAGAWLGRGLWLPRVENALAVEVRAAQVEEVTPAGALSGNLTASGYVVAQRRAALAPKVSGKLEELLVVEGSRVAKDEVIARLEHNDIDAQIGRARAEREETEGEVERASAEIEQVAADEEEQKQAVEAAVAASAEAAASLADARREFAREEKLLADGVGTQSEFDRAKAALEVAGARADQAGARKASAVLRHASLAARRRQAEAAKRSAESRRAARDAAIAFHLAQLEYLTIRAPFAGVVIEKNAEVGEIVAPISGAAQSNVAVVTLVDMDSLMVEADVSESSIARVRPEAPARITLDAFPEEVFPGRVFKVVPTADRQKATVKVKVSFDALDPRIVPEMAARVFFLGDAEKAPETGRGTRLFVPLAALRDDSGGTHVWVLAGGAVSRRPVRAGGRSEGRVEVVEGLRGGERVVVDSKGELREGLKVRETS